MTAQHGRSTSVVPAILFCAVVTTACDPATQRDLQVAVSEAKASVTNLSDKFDSRIVDNQLDHGLVVSFTLTNTGKAGLIRVQPWLTCSDGEWSREQNLTFQAGESMNLTYFFHEPTINSSNIQYGVRANP